MSALNTIFDGDPRLFLNVDGSKLIFTGGQPAMDQGLENQALISLFSAPGWAGNDLFDDPAQQIGSDFEEAAKQTITVTSLNNIRNAALKALESDAFGNITVDVSNPTGFRIDVRILIEPPGSDVKELLLSKSGLNWQAQARSENSALEN
jgi:hypothetical protein